jgi:site-specific recombinase XerD
MATLKKRGSKFSLRFVRTIDGKRQEKTIALETGKKEIALKLKRKLEVDYDSGDIDVFGSFDFKYWRNGDSDRPIYNPLLSDLIEEFLRSRADFKKKTRKNYKSILNRFNQSAGHTLFYTMVKQSDIIEFVYGNDLAIPSQNNYLRHLKVFFKWAEDNDYGDDISKGLKFKKELDTLRQQIISEAELYKIIDCHTRYIQRKKQKGHIARNEQSQLWFAPLVKFTYYTGFRLSEVLNLKWKDVDFSLNEISTVGKGGKLRTMILLDQIKTDLLTWKASVDSKPNRYVFESPKSRQCKSIKMTDNVSDVFKKNVRRAHLDDYIHFHSLRHSCATNLLKMGFHSHSVQKMLGHESFTTTERYLHIVPADIREEAKRIGVMK